MKCYEVSDRVKTGLLIKRGAQEGEDCELVTPKGCSHKLVLDESILKGLRLIPAGLPGNARLESALMKVQDKELRFCRSIRHTKFALVRVETQAGIDGQIQLTSNKHNEAEKNGRIVREYLPLEQALGITPYCSEEGLREATLGAEELDILLLMSPGASCRIFRTGRLEGASPQLYINWNGENLHLSVPRRYEERVAATDGALGALVA